MTYKEITEIPDVKESKYKARKERINNMLLEIYDKHITHAEIIFDDKTEFTSIDNAIDTLRFCARETQRKIYKRDIGNAYSFLPNIFNISKKAGKGYVNVLHRAGDADVKLIEKMTHESEQT